MSKSINNYHEITEEDLSNVTGGVIYCKEDHVIREIKPGDIVLIDEEEYCCCLNSNNQHFEFLKYNRNGQKATGKITRDKIGTTQETLICVGSDLVFLYDNEDMY